MSDKKQAQQNTMEYLDGWKAARIHLNRDSRKSVAWLNGYDDFCRQDQTGNDSYAADHAETEDDL